MPPHWPHLLRCKGLNQVRLISWCKLRHPSLGRIYIARFFKHMSHHVTMSMKKCIEHHRIIELLPGCEPMVASCYITRWGRGHCMQSNGILRMVVQRPKSSQTKQLEADWWLVSCHTASYCSASGKKSLVPARQGQKCGISMWLTECNLGKTKRVKSLYVSLKWFVPTCNLKPRFQPHCSLPTDLCELQHEILEC